MTQPEDAGYIGEALWLSERDITRTFASALVLADVIPEQPELRLELASGTLININVEGSIGLGNAMTSAACSMAPLSSRSEIIGRLLIRLSTLRFICERPTTGMSSSLASSFRL